MNSSFFKFIAFFLILLFICSILGFFNILELNGINQNILLDITSNNFLWPTPNYHTITSSFGYRKRPTVGASIFHNGIDIGASCGAMVIASFSGTVTHIGFRGGGGFTIIIKNGNFSAQYSHLSPDFLCKKNDFISKGQIIGTVGPKIVYGVPNNPYRDYNGNPTNGATTRFSLAFYNKKRRQSRQSFKLCITIIYILSIYSPVLVSILMISPVFINNGTFIS